MLRGQLAHSVLLGEQGARRRLVGEYGLFVLTPQERQPLTHCISSAASDACKSQL
mgnify:CR=1 FL=1